MQAVLCAQMPSHFLPPHYHYLSQHFPFNWVLGTEMLKLMNDLCIWYKLSLVLSGALVGITAPSDTSLAHVQVLYPFLFLILFGNEFLLAFCTLVAGTCFLWLVACFFVLFVLGSVGILPVLVKSEDCQFFFAKLLLYGSNNTFLDVQMYPWTLKGWGILE